MMRLFHWLVLPMAVVATGAVAARPASCPTISARLVDPGILTATTDILAQKRLKGLAAFYNGTDYYASVDGSWQAVDADDGVRGACLVAAVGRFRTLLIDMSHAPPSALVLRPDDSVRFTQPLPARLISAERLNGPLLGSLRYPHLWGVLQPLARAGEWLLQLLNRMGLSWGMAIIVFACLVRLVLLPLSRFTARAQAEVSRDEARLAPALAAIKRSYRGEEAHNRIVALHKELGISTGFRAKPALGGLIQIPFLIAIFNLLGAMPQTRGESFLWIADLSYPDSLARLPVELPLLGQEISVLPFAMAACVAGAGLGMIDFTRPGASRQRRNALLVALLFLVLLYPFPAALVLYWAASSFFQFVFMRFERKLQPDG